MYLYTFKTLIISLITCRKSASCTHISALLHALVALTPVPFPVPSSVPDDEDAESVPVTSLPCQWKQPRKRKESNLKMSDATFEKHVYGQTKKVKLLPIEDYDPRPEKYRNKVDTHMEKFLAAVRGKGLGVSLLMDPSTRYWGENTQPALLPPELPSKEQLECTIVEFIKSLSVTMQQAREIEGKTRSQHHSPEWFAARRYRITASVFGLIYRRKPDTAPDALVVNLLDQRQVTSPAIKWGIEHESEALKAYEEHQHRTGHTELTVCPVGFHVSISHPFLGASPDGGVYDPSKIGEPYGFAEVKCPFKHRDKTPQQACSDPDFCCVLTSSGEIRLKKRHPYYCQIQGQMAIGVRPWCDFIVYTSKGVSVERVHYDQEFWEKDLLPKLEEFYNKCVAPEIVCPVRVLGLPLRDLRRKTVK